MKRWWAAVNPSAGCQRKPPGDRRCSCVPAYHADEKVLVSGAQGLAHSKLPVAGVGQTASSAMDGRPGAHTAGCGGGTPLEPRWRAFNRERSSERSILQAFDLAALGPPQTSLE